MKPIVIAGPCMAEDPIMMRDVAAHMSEELAPLGVDYYFKASYDKANRTTGTAERGPGLGVGLGWLEQVKNSCGVQILTDVHEPWHCKEVAKVADVLQIPAMLCRQTDLIRAAGRTGKTVNIKKGQFFSPEGMVHAAEKAGPWDKVWLCERGSMFGYGDLVVDMRGLKTMCQSGCPVIMDTTHCTQRPPSGSNSKSGAAREFAPLLARAAAASGYLSGFFMEVHPQPNKARSDGPCMLTPEQAVKLLKQVLPIMEQSHYWREELDREVK